VAKNLNIANITVELDDSVKENPLFLGIASIEISKMEIFKYGILNEDIPPRIKENDFEYLESKIPFLYGLYNDFIEIHKDKIVSLADGENSKRISETIGVGVGLFYSTKLLDVNPNIIQRIPAPKKKEGKYLNFKLTKGDTQYEIETKGTINHSNKNRFLEDIQAKKRDSKNTACKYGVVTLANKYENKKPSKIIICDDFDNIKVKDKYHIGKFFEYYKFFLSFILDSTYYNRLISKLDKNKFTRNMIRKNKIRVKYEFNNKIYLGQYFDKRLILDLIANFYYKDIGLNELFKKLTSNTGKQKYFLGIDEDIIDLLNDKDVKGMVVYNKECEVIEESNKTLISDSDGIIFASSENGGDTQIEKNFSEEEVKKRLELIIGSITNKPHECGAPCRSRDKEGKLCEKLTFREHCHFHRD